MNKKAQSRTDELIAKLAQINLSPIEVLSRSIAMAEDNNDYKHMSEVSLELMPYIAPKLKEAQVNFTADITARSCDMTPEELAAELKRLEEIERMAGLNDDDEQDRAKATD